VSQADLLRRIAALLGAAGVPFMVTGSIASATHGTARATRDIDLVIDPDRESLLRFVRSLPEAEYYVNEDAALEALSLRRPFNVIDLAAGWKVDLIVRRTRPFSIEEFRRRRPMRVLDTDTFVATPEDVILSKLEWHAIGGSERQLEDVVGILQLRGATLDVAYIERWARELGVTEPWERAQRLARGE
jgi:hypothetical protein